MGLFDSILGRSKPPAADLDAIFGLPSAAVTLSAAMGFEPTGKGAVAFRAPDGKAFDDVEVEIQELLTASGNPALDRSVDQYGYTWLVVGTDPPDPSALVTHLHAINLTLQDRGFGPQLLCSFAGFRGPQERTLALVYLFKQGCFYPFAPLPGQQVRDTMLELQVRDLIGDDVAIQRDMSRWFPIWGAPGL